jgi:Flp pilus assembly protein TadG
MMAIIWPGLLVLTLLIVQAGLYYHAKQRAAAAADHAAAAAAAEGGSAEVGRRAADDFLRDMPIGAHGKRPAVDVSVNGDRVQVTVSGSIDPIIHFGTWTVSASATAPLEQFIPEPER